MRISDWSSDVCSSDLADERDLLHACLRRREDGSGGGSSGCPPRWRLALDWRDARGDQQLILLARDKLAELGTHTVPERICLQCRAPAGQVGKILVDRKSVVSGKSMTVRERHGGSLCIKTNTQRDKHTN